MIEKTRMIRRAPKRNGSRKEKSWPLLTAQKVYIVNPRTIVAVRIAASRTIFPFEKEQQSPTAKEMVRVKSIKIMRLTGCFLANTISGHSMRRGITSETKKTTRPGVVVVTKTEMSPTKKTTEETPTVTIS